MVSNENDGKFGCGPALAQSEGSNKARISKFITIVPMQLYVICAWQHQPCPAGDSESKPVRSKLSGYSSHWPSRRSQRCGAVSFHAPPGVLSVRGVKLGSPLMRLVCPRACLEIWLLPPRRWSFSHIPFTTHFREALLLLYFSLIVVAVSSNCSASNGVFRSSGIHQNRHQILHTSHCNTLTPSRTLFTTNYDLYCRALLSSSVLSILRR